MEIYPLTADRWNDLVALFQGHGAPGYCWCTYWRIPSNEYSQTDSAGRKEKLRAYVDSGSPIGLIAYVNGEPAGWCSTAPLEQHTRLVRSRTIPSGAEPETWAITCFFIDRKVRRRSLTLELIRSALDYAQKRGARFVEAYPVLPKTLQDGSLDYGVSYRYMGFASTFIKAGFEDITPPGSKRRVLRFSFQGAK